MLFTNFDKYITECKGAIHIGGHKGEERDWYEGKGFKKVIWFEPNYEVYHKLKKHITGLKHHTAYNLGVHDTLKTGILHISSNGGESSSLLAFGTHKDYYPRIRYVSDQEVTLVRMDTIFETVEDIDEYNFLNIDVQGVELNVLKSFGDKLSRLEYIYVEVNTEEVYIGCSLLSEIDEYLKCFGFIRLMTKMTNHKWGDAFYKRY
jgi:FkbM family methyltransferase